MRTFRSIVLDILGWLAIIICFLSALFQFSVSLSDSSQVIYVLIATAISSFILAMILWTLAQILRNQALIIENTKR